MATAPEVPQFDKTKHPAGFEKIWALLRPFLERTASALKGGLTHGTATDGYQPGNLLAFYKELKVPVGAAFPLTVRNELPGPARGVVVWQVREDSNSEAAVGSAAVWADWHNADESGSSVVRIRALTGLDTTKAYTVTLAVYGG